MIVFCEMQILTPKDVILFAHAGAGLLVLLGALWVLVETINVSSADPVQLRRIRSIADMTAFFAVLALICGGYWYLNFYPVEKGLILKGAWPFSHNLFMETKEHLFFVTLILSLYLPIAARDALSTNPAVRKMVLVVSALIVLSALSIEGAGAVISYGAKLALAAKLLH